MSAFTLRERRINLEGRDYLIREMTGGQALKVMSLISESAEQGDMADAYAHAIACSFLNVDGTPVVSVEQAYNLPSRIMTTVGPMILNLSEAEEHQKKVLTALGGG